MPNTQVDLHAVIQGKQRSARYKYRHTIAGAADEIEIPVGWVWFWYHEGRLRSQNWLRRIWVRLDHVQRLFSDRKAVCDAFYATGEPLTSAQAIRQVLDSWPRSPQQMCVQAPPKKPAVSVVLLRTNPMDMVPDPVLRKEKEA
jgi:hypothetical protein